MKGLLSSEFMLLNQPVCQVSFTLHPPEGGTLRSGFAPPKGGWGVENSELDSPPLPGVGAVRLVGKSKPTKVDLEVNEIENNLK